MSASEETLALLRRIAASNDAILAALKSNGSGGVGEIADDRDLDGRYGDEEVKFSPKDWTGAPMKGKRMSQCPPEFLDMLAETFDYFTKKAEETKEEYNGKPVAPYKRKSAARARGWAVRIRSGKHHAPARAGGTGGAPDGGDDDWGSDRGASW